MSEEVPLFVVMASQDSRLNHYYGEPGVIFWKLALIQTDGKTRPKHINPRFKCVVNIKKMRCGLTEQQKNHLFKIWSKEAEELNNEK